MVAYLRSMHQKSLYLGHTKLIHKSLVAKEEPPHAINTSVAPKKYNIPPNINETLGPDRKHHIYHEFMIITLFCIIRGSLSYYNILIILLTLNKIQSYIFIKNINSYLIQFINL
ncbi:hypothetical protein FWK35_00000052 [Aphis craccivora]|uniref:Uncharacterized protein n=1 Tax=Aphis craccivora TaxID=307492 RepID=A0A6G0ZR21_APHCR|nr:hypothetical protein FWK35_00000052 [Aphis craccivora]